MAQIQSIGSGVDTLISNRNQTVVPAKIRKALKLQSGDKLSWSLIQIGDAVKIIAEPKVKNWANYTKGLGKHVWKNIDIDSYIKDLRKEWPNQE